MSRRAISSGSVIGDRFEERVQWAGVRDALVRPVRVVELLELPQCVEEMPLVPDQGAVQQFTAAGLHPPVHDGVHAGDPDATEHDLDPRVGEDRVEQFGELPVPVPDHVAGLAAGVLEIHDEIPGGLRHPGGGRVRRRAKARMRRRRARSPRTRTAASRTE
jgi:hypothetical protein